MAKKDTGRGVIFGPQTAQRLLRLANGSPGIYRPAAVRKIIRRLQGSLYLTTSTITARTGTSSPWTPGSGTGTLLEFYDDSGTLKVRTTSSTGITLRHMGTATIASGRIVQCKQVGDQTLIDVDYC